LYYWYVRWSRNILTYRSGLNSEKVKKDPGGRLPQLVGGKLSNCLTFLIGKVAVSTLLRKIDIEKGKVGAEC
jgi:hypothetical protein